MSKICPTCQRVYEDEHIFCAADGTALRGESSGDDLIGSVIDDRYVITALLGQGGMGRVYLGHHVHLPRQVAVKVLHARLANDPGAVARFNREASNASRIEHHRVARVFDFGRMPGGTTYLAMEYVPGRTLSAILESEGALAPSRVAGLIGQTAEGLTAAHRLNIIHRDLKPDNVLIMDDGDGGEAVKIVDFGIAKAIAEDEGTLTAPGYVTGTPEYMSPEQLLGQTLDQRSDVFALGLLAFRMLTNALPFDPPTPERGFGSTLSDAPRRLDMVAPMRQWPLGLQVVFDRVLARDPEARFPNAESFATALRDVIAEWEKTNLRNNATPTLGMSSGAGETPDVAASNAALAATVPAMAQSERDIPATHDAPARARRWLYPAAAGLAVAAVAVAALAWFGGTSAGVADSVAVDSAAAIAAADSTRVADSVRIANASRAGDSIRIASATRAADSARIVDSLARIEAARIANTSRNAARNENTAGATRTDSPAISVLRTPARVVARIDSVRDAVDALLLAGDGRDATARASALVSRIDALLPDVLTAGDSARALLLKANMQETAGNRPRACTTLAQVRALATSASDRNAVRRNSDLWGC